MSSTPNSTPTRARNSVYVQKKRRANDAPIDFPEMDFESIIQNMDSLQGHELTVLGVPRAKPSEFLTAREAADACIALVRDVCDRVETELTNNPSWPSGPPRVIVEMLQPDPNDSNIVYVRVDPDCAPSKDDSLPAPTILSPFLVELDNIPEWIASWSQCARGKDRRVKVNIINATNFDKKGTRLDKKNQDKEKEYVHTIASYLSEVSGWQGIQHAYPMPMGLTIVFDHPDQAARYAEARIPEKIPSVDIPHQLRTQPVKVQYEISIPGQMTFTPRGDSFHDNHRNAIYTFLRTHLRDKDGNHIEVPDISIQNEGNTRGIHISPANWDHVTVCNDLFLTTVFQKAIAPLCIDGPFFTYNLNSYSQGKTANQKFNEAEATASRVADAVNARQESSDKRTKALEDRQAVTDARMETLQTSIIGLSNSVQQTNNTVATLAFKFENHTIMNSMKGEVSDLRTELAINNLILNSTQDPERRKQILNECEEKIARIKELQEDIRISKEAERAALAPPPNPNTQLLTDNTAPPQYTSPARTPAITPSVTPAPSPDPSARQTPPSRPRQPSRSPETSPSRHTKRQKAMAASKKEKEEKRKASNPSSKAKAKHILAAGRTAKTLETQEASQTVDEEMGDGEGSGSREAIVIDNETAEPQAAHASSPEFSDTESEEL